MSSIRASLLAVAIICGVAPDARALDKQGAAHKGQGDDAAPSTGFQLSGQLFLGILPYNPTYAARPDNTGHALFRAGGHMDINLIGEKLFIPLDLNLFTDRDTSAARPSEIDVIGGLASTWPVPGGNAELGARGELDTSADGRGAGDKGRAQGYVDVRGRYITSLGRRFSGLDALLRGGDISGWLTWGWFAWNPSYYARPDNSGVALFRYAAHADVSFWRNHLALMLDGTSFTDRHANPVRPSELDFTVGISAMLGAWTAQLAYERDMPIDGRSVTNLVQHMVMLQGVWSVAWAGPASHEAIH